MSGINSGTGESGSTAWNGSFRSRLYLKPEENSDTRILTRMKANYATIGDEHKLVWVDGYLMPENEVAKTPQEENKENWATAFHTCLQHCNQKGIEVSPASNSHHYYGKSFPDLWASLDRRHRKVTRKQFEIVYPILSVVEGTVKIKKGSRKSHGDRLIFEGYET
jgi:hypothetical protein